ncbi:MAG: aminopeptidase P family protein [Thermosyntropha sp.]|nr:aminopeptidase P family protein [Thermosyntropha sp.]
MKNKGIDAFLVNKPENIYYLSGFTGGVDGKLLILDDEQYVITDTRYEEQVKNEAPDFALLLGRFPYIDSLNAIEHKFEKLGIEGKVISYYEYEMLKKNLDVSLVPLEGLVEEIRMIKEEEELDFIRKAAGIGDSVFEEICLFIKPGIYEKQIADKIIFLLREKGCEKEAFEVIALSGRNASLPHGRPGAKPIEDGDMLTLDYGGFFGRYASDMTRTVSVGKPSDYLKDVYFEVLRAQKIGLSMVKAGVSCREVDKAVRDYLEGCGLGEYFVHSTGHGLGLEIHENPALSPHCDIILQENMVVTVEPGVYVPGTGGVRIEDTVIVKQDGCEIITRADKELRIIKWRDI